MKSLTCNELEWRLMRACLTVLLVGWASWAAAQDLRRYTIRIDLPGGGALSGLCLVRTGGGQDAMSVFNEFGIKAFDAVAQGRKGRVKLRNVMAPMDKWLVRRMLARDMAVIMYPDRRLPRRRTLYRHADGSLELTNHRMKITYRLTPIAHATE